MRQGQSKRIRGRGRGGGGGGGGGGGKGGNALNRSYESNGPDVKIRGTAGTIADKYVQLSRDALSAGDPVAAENYMQHAEHYYRLLAAAQAQFQGHQSFVRADADDFADPDAEDENEAGDANGQQAFGGQPYQGGGNNNQQRNNGQRNNGHNNQNGRDGGFNGGGEQRRFDRRDQRFERNERPNDRNERYGEQNQDRGDRRPERSDDQPDVGGLPAFITRDAPPVAAEAPFKPGAEQPDVERADPPAEAAAESAVEAQASEQDEGRAPRGRRRRYGRFGRGGAAGEEGGDAAETPPASEPSSD